MHSPFSQQDERWMNVAIDLARQAESEAEVPVGAVLIANEQVVARAWNKPISKKDPTAHAEILALREAAQALDNYRLLDTTLYVTLEPCMMCAGALIHARIQRLVFGAHDPKAGVVGSVMNVLELKALNHRVQWQSGLLAEECGLLLKNFFKRKRECS